MLAQIIRDGQWSTPPPPRPPLPRSPIRFRLFVPAVSISVLTTLVWCCWAGIRLCAGPGHLGAGHHCPCALGLATPVSSWWATVWGQNGILFKTAASLEAAGRTQIVALDKTGTITSGEPRVTDILPAEGRFRERAADAGGLAGAEE